MQSGKLRHRLKLLENQGTTLDAAGHVIADWQPIDTLWASVEPTAGAERWHGMQLKADTTHVVQIRYRPGITTNHRFQFQTTRTLEISQVLDPEERNRELVIQCVETQ